MHFYKPMLAEPISKPFSGKDWFFEIKWDGFRAIANVDDRFSLQSHNSKELYSVSTDFMTIFSTYVLLLTEHSH